MNWTNEYRRKWYQARRRALITELGGKCKHCGQTKNLAIDHINGREYEPRKLSSNQRLLRYCKEAKLGKVQLLCEPCNKAKGTPVVQEKDGEYAF